MVLPITKVGHIYLNYYFFVYWESISIWFDLCCAEVGIDSSMRKSSVVECKIKDNFSLTFSQFPSLINKLTPTAG